MQREERTWASKKYWLYIFTTLSLISLFFSWKGFITFLPAAAAILATYGFYQEKPNKIRRYMLVACLLWIPYAFVVHSYSGVVSNTVAALGVLLGMYRLDRKKIAPMEASA